MFHVEHPRNAYIVGPVLLTLAESLSQELAALAARDRLRRCPPLEAEPYPAGPSRTHVELDGHRVVSFCSNDYLGLACHPALLAAASAAALHSGFGAGASRLVSGDLPEHRSLETRISSLVGLPAALLFPTGYQANLGLLSTLANGSDLIVSDAANHASLIDGCRLSRATVKIYPHVNVSAARAHLTDAASDYRRRFLVTESLFSMDGDTAPIADLADVARMTRSAFLVDEAHALGVLGPSGRGLCAAAGVTPDALTGTFGKALGGFGAFVAGAPELRAILENRARTFVFTTSPPPLVAAAAEAAIHLALGPEGDDRRAVVASHAEVLLCRLARLPFLRHPSRNAPIIPVVLGDDRRAVDVSRSLLTRGFFAQAIRPPTVPEGTARLRLTLSAAHTRDEVSALADTLLDLLAPA
jgi:8-amino-7-oxononanoate synthase